MSMRTLKRLLKHQKLYRRAHYSDVVDVALFLLKELLTSNQLHGYKLMHLKCLHEGFIVTQETVRQLLHIVDADGINMRRRHRLQRRIYFSLGPNYLWHMDSYDKLRPYGICINGAIDGYSRYVVWLKANKSCNPRIVARHFMEAVRARQSCPYRIRADKGTENGHTKQMLMFMRRRGRDPHASKCFLEGSSNHNQRIEQWWSFLRKHCAQYWMSHFEMMKSCDIFDGGFIDKALIQFCFLHLIQVSNVYYMLIIQNDRRYMLKYLTSS